MSEKGDLVVVCADGGIEQTLRGLLCRPYALGIRPLQNVEYPKEKQMDAGTLHRGSEISKLYLKSHTHAMVVLDYQWDGHKYKNRIEMQNKVNSELATVWRERGRCIVIAPELENWIWSNSPHVAETLGFSDMSSLREYLGKNNMWSESRPKPNNPKQAYETAIKSNGIPQSNSLLKKLATKVNFSRCTDPAFLELLEILRTWFPAV